MMIFRRPGLWDRIFPGAPSLLIDPVEGFFSGLSSGLVRCLCGVVAIFAGAGLCLLPLSSEMHGMFLYTMGPLLLGQIFYWATFGAWFFVGLLAFVGMFTAFWAFTQEISQKLTFFLIFSASTLYYLPISWSFESRWGWVVALYTFCSTLYWFSPWGLELWQNWRTARLASAENLPAPPPLPTEK